MLVFYLKDSTQWFHWIFNPNGFPSQRAYCQPFDNLFEIFLII